MVALAFLNVLTRYLFRYPLAFTEELLVNAFVWVTLLALPSALGKAQKGPISASWPLPSPFLLPGGGPS